MTTCNLDWRHASFSLYRYEPAVAPAVVFCLLFLITTVLHAWQMYRTRAWFLGALVGGCFAEFVGYAARASSASQGAGCWSMMPYIIQSVFILLAPALFSASIYIILGRIIKVTDGDAHALIKGGRITKLFVTGDLICLFMQCAAGGMMGGARAVPILADIGKGVVIASLMIQLVWFGFFVVVACLFHRSMLLLPTAMAQRPEVRWQSYLYTLYVISSLVMIRSLVRAVEFIQGSNGALQSTEVYFYIFDSILMFVAVTYLHWKHPGEINRLLQGDESPCSNGLRLFQVDSAYELMKGFKK